MAALAPRPAQAQTSVTTQRYDNARSGCNTGETTLNTSNVNPKQFGKLFSRDVVGDVYAQPLIVSGLAMPKAGTRNVMFVATQANNVYAFDAKSQTLYLVARAKNAGENWWRRDGLNPLNVARAKSKVTNVTP